MRGKGERNREMQMSKKEQRERMLVTSWCWASSKEKLRTERRRQMDLETTIEKRHLYCLLVPSNSSWWPWYDGSHSSSWLLWPAWLLWLFRRLPSPTSLPPSYSLNQCATLKHLAVPVYTIGVVVVVVAGISDVAVRCHAWSEQRKPNALFGFYWLVPSNPVDACQYQRNIVVYASACTNQVSGKIRETPHCKKYSAEQKRRVDENWARLYHHCSAWCTIRSSRRYLRCVSTIELDFTKARIHRKFRSSESIAHLNHAFVLGIDRTAFR